MSKKSISKSQKWPNLFFLVTLFVFKEKKKFRLLIQKIFEFRLFGMTKVKIAYFRQNSSKSIKIFFGASRNFERNYFQ